MLSERAWLINASIYIFRARGLASVAAYLDELNLSGPLTRRCQRMAQGMARG